jgi:hypothetical protein
LLLLSAPFVLLHHREEASLRRLGEPQTQILHQRAIDVRAFLKPGARRADGGRDFLHDDRDYIAGEALRASGIPAPLAGVR